MTTILLNSARLLLSQEPLGIHKVLSMNTLTVEHTILNAYISSIDIQRQRRVVWVVFFKVPELQCSEGFRNIRGCRDLIDYFYLFIYFLNFWLCMQPWRWRHQDPWDRPTSGQFSDDSAAVEVEMEIDLKTQKRKMHFSTGGHGSHTGAGSWIHSLLGEMS